MAYTQEQIDGARAWAQGKSAGEIQSEAQRLGIDSATLSQVTAPAASFSAPVATPAPSFDQGTLNTLYEQERRSGKDDAGLWGAAQGYGVNQDQFNLAKSAFDSKISGAQQWASGKSADQILSKASEMGLSPGEVGMMFGQFGGSGDQVTKQTGYGSGITGFNPDGTFKYNTGYVGGIASDGSKLSDWTFDAANGWTQKLPPKKTGGGVGADGMPTTGINLSQLQTATPWEVAQNQTVANQLSQIIATDSPLMQQAKMRALQAANQRGLLNSSMAVSAGESALYDAAMPIAQQDASTYADAAKFNAGESNTFSRDNNAFVRDAFMADFNLAANEWAKQQDQTRKYAELDYGQRLTLERDAVQNGYQSARDAILNGYTVERDATTNAFTLKRDATQNEFTASQSGLERVAALQRAAMGIQPDTSVQRTAMQIAADSEQRGLDRDATAQSRQDEIRVNAQGKLDAYKTEYSKLVADISIKGLDPDVAAKAVGQLTQQYRPIVESYAAQAGLDPTIALAGMNFEPTKPASPSNVVESLSQSGNGD